LGSLAWLGAPLRKVEAPCKGRLKKSHKSSWAALQQKVQQPREEIFQQFMQLPSILGLDVGKHSNDI